MKDTLRVLVGWDCNLYCSYCCNLIPEIRKNIIPTRLQDVEWDKYQTFCISGGEPLMDMKMVRNICKHIPEGRLIVLYTNGTLLTRPIAKSLVNLKVRALNVGLHRDAFNGMRYLISGFAELIESTLDSTQDLPLNVRFCVQNIYEEAWNLSKCFPYTKFRFWKMNDCTRDNEDRIILI